MVWKLFPSGMRTNFCVSNQILSKFVDISSPFRTEVALLLVNGYHANMELLKIFILSSGLYKHLDGLTNDIERSSELYSSFLSLLNYLFFFVH